MGMATPRYRVGADGGQAMDAVTESFPPPRALSSLEQQHSSLARLGAEGRRSADESDPCCDGTGAPRDATSGSESRHRHSYHPAPHHGDRHPSRLKRKQPTYDDTQTRACQVAPRREEESCSSTPSRCSLCSPVPVPPLSSMTRGEREVSGWQRKSSCGEVHGHLKNCMAGRRSPLAPCSGTGKKSFCQVGLCDNKA